MGESSAEGREPGGGGKPKSQHGGRGGGGQNKRQSVNTSVKPGNFAMYKRQIMCQKASGECQNVRRSNHG
jgi:hypothetical protein